MAGLTSLPYDPLLDLAPWMGQRQATFRFNLTDGVTGQNLGIINPIRGATLSHDTTRTIKRQLSLALGKDDTAAVNGARDRVTVTMVFPNGQEYPLGRYMFTDYSRQVFTSGKLAQPALNDEMFLVAQEISVGFSTLVVSVNRAIRDLLTPLPIKFTIEETGFQSSQGWTVGANRGSILEDLANTGDYFSPWFDNTGVMRFIRSFDPITKIPEFDYDKGNQVLRSDILENDNLLTAPNRFTVISNAGTSEGNTPIVATVDVPATAPHSIANRGFIIQQTEDMQLTSQAQAFAVATNLANRNTVFETVNLTTPPDPRHDSYNVIRWQNELWLELSWSMALVEGGGMNHLLRKAYKA